MSKSGKQVYYFCVGLIATLLFAANVVNLPRGPQLHCYRDVTTYNARQSSYGFPFVFMHGNTTGDSCSLPAEKLTDTNYLSGNDYDFRPIILALDIAIALLLVGGLYYLGAADKKRVPAVGKRVTKKTGAKTKNRNKSA